MKFIIQITFLAVLLMSAMASPLGRRGSGSRGYRDDPYSNEQGGQSYEVREQHHGQRYNQQRQPQYQQPQYQQPQYQQQPQEQYRREQYQQPQQYRQPYRGLGY